MDKSFKHKFSSWTKSISNNAEVDWVEQLRILNEIADLITPQLSLEEIIASIYQNVNQLTDAYQFCVGIYDEKEGLIHYKGMIENGIRFPDFSIDALDDSRLASWCIRNEQDIFMNDFDREYNNYLLVKPQPLAGIQPQAALYTPLKLNDKIVGLVVVRTIHKNVYQPHHLYVLKTVGNFVVRALEFARMYGKPFVQGTGRTKEWRWNNKEQFPVKSKKQLSMLTEREKDVLLLLVTGLPNKTIAEKLFISADTVKTHTLNIYRKMEVANRSSAILKAVELGWII
ncbi:MAG TPA: LuxR C-terminal-related transcriptional regulator [Chitinophagaceae bacterium]|nr:LuxR C-terminal-related transcriptional regulator [Chitinophagaceae bacterium]